MTVPNLHASRFDAVCSHLIYEASYFMAMFGLTLGFSLRFAGRHNIPVAGPALLVANHQSFLDPILIGVATRRHLCYLGRKTLFKNPAFAWLIRMVNAVPIDQEGVGKEGLKTTIEQLNLGQAVVMFPEGERTPHGDMLPFKPGIHLLIKRAQALVVPVGIAGAYDAWPRWRSYPIPSPLFMQASQRCIGVSIGEPIEARALTELPREKALSHLYDAIHVQWQNAERIRRKS